MYREKESKIIEVIKKEGFENVSVGLLNESKDLYKPQLFDVSLIENQIRTDDKCDTIIRVRYFSKEDRYGFSIYKEKKE